MASSQHGGENPSREPEETSRWLLGSCTGKSTLDTRPVSDHDNTPTSRSSNLCLHRERIPHVQEEGHSVIPERSWRQDRWTYQHVRQEGFDQDT